MNSVTVYIYWPIALLIFGTLSFTQYKYGVGERYSFGRKGRQLDIIVAIIAWSVGIGGTILMFPMWWALWRGG